MFPAADLAGARSELIAIRGPSGWSFHADAADPTLRIELEERPERLETTR